MAINFPTSLDTLTNPVAGDATNSVTVPHATQHSNLNDAVEALEARVGITGSAVTSSLTYRVAAVETTTVLLSTGAWTSWTPVYTQTATPTFTNSGSRYSKSGRVVTAMSSVNFTSAGTGGAQIKCSLPFPASFANTNAVGTWQYYHTTGAVFASGVVLMSSTTELRFIAGGSGLVDFLGVLPAYTIANGSSMNFTITYESAS